MTEFYRFDRWDAYIGPITGIVSAVHYQQAGGENSLTLTTMEKGLNKGDRVVWRDGQGLWREHVANEPKDSHADDGSVTYETYCEDALNEVFRDIVDDVRVRSGTADSALDKILQRTRWSRGTVDVAGSRTKSFYHISAGEALQEMVKAWGGELYSSFEADDNGITARKVNLVAGMGSRSTHKRFEYGKDLAGVTRTVAPDDVYTAMRGFGKGDDLGDDDGDTNGRRITFADINGGRDYVEDEDALRRWGRPDGKGGRAHSFGTVVFQDCEDPKELMELTRKALDEAKAPRVSYECSVRDLTAQGRYWEGVAVGDDVQVVDTAFTPALRLEARVMAVRRNLADPSDVEVTIGNVRNTISDEISGIVSQIAGIGQQSSSWDAAVQLGSNYLNRVIETLNANFEQGGVYKYESFEQGTVYSSVPLDEDMRPIRTPASAFQLKGGGFRIASGTKADGSFNWRTFGTGEGFTADCLTAGVIRGGANYWNLETGDLLFKKGGIRDSKGKNSWNLDTGEFALSSTATVGGKAVSDIADEAVESQTQMDIFNKLTNGGQTQGIYLADGKLYINGDYIKAGTVRTDKIVANTGAYVRVYGVSSGINLRFSNGFDIGCGYMSDGSPWFEIESPVDNNGGCYSIWSSDFGGIRLGYHDSEGGFYGLEVRNDGSLSTYSPLARELLRVSKNGNFKIGDLISQNGQLYYGGHQIV